MKIYLSTSASPKENQHASYLNIVNKYTATEVKHHAVYIVKWEFFFEWAVKNGQSRDTGNTGHMSKWTKWKANKNRVKTQVFVKGKHFLLSKNMIQLFIIYHNGLDHGLVIYVVKYRQINVCDYWRDTQECSVQIYRHKLRNEKKNKKINNTEN